MKLRPWHLGAALIASVTLHFGAVALTVDTSEEPALLEGGSGGPVTMLGEAYTDMLTSGDPDSQNAIAEEAPETLAPIDPNVTEAEPQEELTPQETETQEPLPEVTEVQPQDIKPLEIEPVEDAALMPLASAEAIMPLNEAPEETVTAIEPVPVPEVRPKDLPVKTAEAKPEQQKKIKKPVAQRPPSAQKGQNRANSAKGAGGVANLVATQGGSEASGQAQILGNSDRTNYKGKVQRALQRAMRRVKANSGGQATVSFVIARDGSVSSVRVSASSGNPEVDEAALNLVHRAAPFPPIPNEEGRASWAFNLPVQINSR